MSESATALARVSALARQRLAVALIQRIVVRCLEITVKLDDFLGGPMWQHIALDDVKLKGQERGEGGSVERRGKKFSL